MTDRQMISILGSGLCIPDTAIAAALGFADCDLDPAILPPLIRRRTSLATRMAVTAAERACKAARVEPDLPAIFVSAVGESKVTDRLCQAIAEQAFPVSPTQFHNSVHNTAAGYWSIAVGSMQPMLAMGGMQDGFALGLLEAWCQLVTGQRRLLLICYDESIPEFLLHNWQPCAVALVLGQAEKDRAAISRPWQEMDKVSSDADFKARSPAYEALPLLRRLQSTEPGDANVEVCAGPSRWLTRLVVP
jgi:hypothetical protein